MTSTADLAPPAPRAGAHRPTVIGIVRSELVRLRRPGLLLGWFGLTAVFAALINVVMFQVAGQGGDQPVGGPGTTFPTAAELLSEQGIVSGLAAAASMFGVVALIFWALAAATDYSSGLVRLLVSAEPRRWRLLLGKWIALAALTAVSTVVAVVVNLVVAPVAAQAAGYSPDAWGTDIGPIVLSAAGNLFGALLVWGTIGLVLATLTRSAGISIGVGVGYVLLVESVLTAALSGIRDWLPGTVIGALAHGGTADVGYGTALALGGSYVVVAVAVAVAVFRRRDVID